MESKAGSHTIVAHDSVPITCVFVIYGWSLVKLRDSLIFWSCDDVSKQFCVLCKVHIGLIQ